MLYILGLEVGHLLHTRPSGVLGVSEGHSSDAYRHSDGTQCLNCRGFPSVAGVSACLMYVKTIAKEHPKYNSKQPKYTRSIAEVYIRGVAEVQPNTMTDVRGRSIAKVYIVSVL